jgi:hypothetical protein
MSPMPSQYGVMCVHVINGILASGAICMIRHPNRIFQECPFFLQRHGGGFVAAAEHIPDPGCNL